MPGVLVNSLQRNKVLKAIGEPLLKEIEDPEPIIAEVKPKEVEQEPAGQLSLVSAINTN